MGQYYPTAKSINTASKLRLLIVLAGTAANIALLIADVQRRAAR